MTPSINIIGGTLAAVGLAVVIFFGVREGDIPPSPPAPPVSTVAPTPAPRVLKRPVVRKPRAPHSRKDSIQIQCGYVPDDVSTLAQRYDKEQILDAAAAYGLSPAQVSALRTCLN